MSSPTILIGYSWADGATVTPARLNDSVNLATLRTTQTDVLVGRSTSGAGVAEEIPCTAAGRALLDDANAAAQRATLGVHDLFQANTDTLAYSATTTVDFDPSVKGAQVLTLAGNLTLASANLALGRGKILLLVGDGSSRTLTFPASWVFVGASAPSALGAGKVAQLMLQSWGTTDATVIAAYAAQP